MATKNTSPLLKTIVGVVAIVAVIWLIFQVISGLYSLLWYIGPILLIATFIMNKSVIFNYVKWIGKLFKTSPVAGAGAGILSFFGFPFVSAFLFGKAFLLKKLNVDSSGQSKKNEEFTEFEEVESETIENLDLEELEEFEEFEELETLEKPEADLDQLRDSNDYESFFEDNK